MIASKLTQRAIPIQSKSRRRTPLSPPVLVAPRKTMAMIAIRINQKNQTNPTITLTHPQPKTPKKNPPDHSPYPANNAKNTQGLLVSTVIAFSNPRYSCRMIDRERRTARSRRFRKLSAPMCPDATQNAFGCSAPHRRCLPHRGT